MQSSIQYGFVIDNRVCIGCHACTVACKAEHLVPIGVNRTWVKYIEKGAYPNVRRNFQVSRCNHCTDAPCVTICPVTALFTRDDGIVDFDNRRCIGCKACTQACPYDAIYIDPSTDTAAKCNFCAHRIDQGLNPSCVNVCPEQAIRFGDLNDPLSDVSRLIARETATVRKPEKGTLPNLYYIDGDRAALDPFATTPTHETMWSNQVRGVGHNEGVGGDVFDLLGLVRRAQVTQHDRAEAGYSYLGGGHSCPPSSVGVASLPPGSGHSMGAKMAPPHGLDLHSIVRSLEQNTASTHVRRAYDQPDKGVQWGWEVAAYVVTKAIGTGIVFVAALAAILSQFSTGDFSAGLPGSVGSAWLLPLLGLVFLGLTGALLVKDLDQPRRFLYVILRPQWKSWLVRGAYILMVFGGLVTLWLGATLVLSQENAEAVFGWLAWPLLLGSVAGAGYTGFLFGQCKGRDFWQSPGLILHMALHAPVAGFAVIAIMASLGLGFAGLGAAAVAWGIGITVLLSLAITMVEIFGRHMTRDAAQTAQDMRSGKAGRYFWYGVIAAGHLLPLLLCGLVLAGIGDTLGLTGTDSIASFASAAGATATAVLVNAAAGLLTLIGMALSMYLWVYLPQKRPNV